MPNYAQLTDGTGNGNVALAPQAAEGLIQQVLGRGLDLYKGGRIPEEMPPDQIQDLINLLALRFQKIVDPRTETTTYEWQTPPPRVTIGALMPVKLVGAQASLCRRTQKAVADALSLLDNIGPIIADARAEVVDDKKTVIRSELNAILTELCRVPQPRAVQVDMLFEALLNTGEGGHLAELLKAAGLDEPNVETLADDEMLTNFFTVRDYVGPMRTSWLEWKENMDVFLGTQVMRLSSTLPVVRATVQSVRDAFAQAGVVEAELRIVGLHFPGILGYQVKTDLREMTVDDLLSLIEGEADRWGQLLMDGGKSGVRSITPYADAVNEILRGALRAAILAPSYNISAEVSPKETAKGYPNLHKVTGHVTEDVRTLGRLSFLDLNHHVRLAVQRLQVEMEEIVSICHQDDEDQARPNPEQGAIS